MAEVNASFQKLAHAEVGQRHDSSPVDPPRTESPAIGPDTGRLEAKVRV
jgi:hypothetical protein